MSHKLNRSQSGRRSRQGSQNRMRAQDFFANRQTIENDPENEEQDITLVERPRGRQPRYHQNMETPDSESSFEYFTREQISDKNQERQSRDSRSSAQNPFNNTTEQLFVQRQDVIQAPNSRQFNTIQEPDDHFAFIPDLQASPNFQNAQNSIELPNYLTGKPRISSKEINRKSAQNVKTNKIFKNSPIGNIHQTPQINVNNVDSGMFSGVSVEQQKSARGRKSINQREARTTQLLAQTQEGISMRTEQKSSSRSRPSQLSYSDIIKKSRKGRSKSKKSRMEEPVMSDTMSHNQVRDEDGRVPAPPQPQSFVNFNNAMAAKGGGGGGAGGMLGGADDDEDGPKNFFEPISYSKLQRVIGTYHPIDPETKTRFSMDDRITVKDYVAKLSDACFCYMLGQKLKAATKYMKQKLKGKKEVKFVRPESMADLPDSNSSSEDSDADENNGITECSLALGDGATLYLQMMKTFAIMFCLLTVINIPIYVIYEQNTEGNDWGDLGKLFKFFTIGNLGQLTKKCGASNFHWHFHETEALTDEFIEISCGEGYIGEIQQFGFLYNIDKLYGGESNGTATCKHIMEPTAEYKKPAPVIIECSKDELGDEDFDMCEVERRQAIGEFGEDEYLIELEIVLNRYLPDDEKIPEEDIRQKFLTANLHEIWDAEALGLEIPETPDTEQDVVAAQEANIDPICRYDPRRDGKRASSIWHGKDSLSKFEEFFQENCYYKSECKFDPESVGFKKGDKDEYGEEFPEDRLGLFGLISDECKMRMSHPVFQNITSQEYIAVIGCKYDDVKIPFSSKRLHKEVIGIIIVGIDFGSILIMIYFFSKINILNNEFLSSIDDLRVQMKDFGVKINNVKLDKYTQDSRIVKIKIWLYFKEILEANKDRYNDMQCVDVCLSLYTQPSIQCVFRMQEIQIEIDNINNNLYAGQYKEDEIPDKQEELKLLLEKQKRFEVRYKQLTQRPKVDSNNQNLAVTRIPKSQKIKEIQYIFVVFKNCETREIVLEKFKKENVTISCFKKIFPQDKTVEIREQKMLFGRKPQIVPILEPDEIIWENLAFTGEEQKARGLAVNVFSVFFLLLNTLFTMYLSGFSTFLNKKIPDPVGCPDVGVTKREAFVDAIKGWDDDPSEDPVGLLGCYCKANTSIFLPWTIIRQNFVEFSDLNIYKEGEDKRNYCLEWWGLQYLKQLCLFFISTSAVFINEIVADFFQKLGQFQKKHTVVEEQTTCFRQIFTQEYINMGIIVLIQSFDQLGITKMLLGALSSNTEVFKGFEPGWYMTFGNKVCVMIFMSSFLVNSKDIIKFLVQVLSRFRDRKFKMNVKLDPEDEDCDLPNTRIRIQSNLEKLYTGIGFKGEKAYSRMMSTMFVIQMYSSGMPILYFNGFIFYTVTYFVNKFLLIHYYQKSRTLTRTIPLFTMSYLKYGIILHMATACLMLTNKLAFITKNREHGVNALYNTKETIDELNKHGITTDSSYIEDMVDRFKFFHQQLYFTLLVGLILTFFVGRSIYAMILFVIQQIAKLIQMGITKFYENVKEKAQLLLDKRARDKKKMQDAMRAALARKVFSVQRQQSQLIKQKLEAKAKEEQNKLEHELHNCDSHDHDRKQSISNKILEAKIKVQQELEELENKNSQDDFPKVDEDGVPLSEDEQYEAYMERQRIKKLQEEAEAAKKEADIIKKELQKKRANRPDYSDNILNELSTDNLSNFYERSIRELQDFWEIFQYNDEIGAMFLDPESKSPYRTLFLETLYTYRISVDECVEYQAFLIQRIKDIESIIDKYFDLLIPTLIKKMKESFDRNRNRRKKEGKEGTLMDQVMQRKYEEWFVKHSDDVQFHNPKYYSYKRKMKILVDLQDELIQADKNRKENRQGIQDVCRMTGSLSQSYFIFDAQEYKVGRKIYYGIEVEEEAVDELGDLLNDGQSNSDKRKQQPEESNQESSDSSDETSRSEQPKSKKTSMVSQKSVNRNLKLNKVAIN